MANKTTFKSKDSQIAKLVGITKNSATAIRNKSYWNFNNLNCKILVTMGLLTQKELMDAIEKANRRIKRKKRKKKKHKFKKHMKYIGQINDKVITEFLFGGSY